MYSVGASSYIQNKPTSLSKASKCFHRFLCFLTWPSGYPKSLQYFFLIASNLQYILLLLHLQLRYYSSGQNSGLSLTVNKICKALLLRNLTTSQLDGWVLAVYIYLGNLLSGTCFLLFLAFRNYKISRRAKHVIVTICQFHLSIAFWLCNAILLYSLTTAKDSHTKFFETSFGSSGLITWHIFLLILNFLISGMISIYSYDPLKWSNDLGMSTPIAQFLTFAFKGIVCLRLFLLYKGTSVKWLLGLISLLISCFRHFHLITRFPYYEHKPLRVSLMMSSVAVLITFISMLILCFEKIESLNGNAIFYLEALIVCLGVKINDEYFQNQVLRYLSTSSLHSEDDVLKRIFALYYTRRNLKLTANLEEPFSLKEIQFWGVWSFDSDQVKSCTEKIQVIQEEIEAKIYELLSSSIEKYKENKKLKLLLANFILHQDEGMLKGLDLLQQLRRSQGGFNRVKSAILWEEFQKKLQNKYEGNLDIKTFLQFEEYSRKFVEMVYSNTKRYLDFWKTYTKTSLDLMDLVRQSESIEDNDKRITKFWNNFKLKENYQQKEFIILYSVYLSIIRNAKYASSKLRVKLLLYEKSFGHNLEEEQDELTQITLMSPENLSFHISMEKETFGKILYYSENAVKKLGWRKKEFFPKTLEMMLSRFLRKEIMQILRGGDGKTLKDPRFNRVIDCFLVNSENWVIPCHVFYCLYPKIKEELKILALFRVKSRHEEMIIVNNQGVIQGATQRIGQLLGLQGIISLEDICQVDYASIFNEKGLKLSFHLKEERNKIILEECSVSIEEYSLKEKYWILKFPSEDILKAETKESDLEEEEEEIPSERIEWMPTSPIDSTRNLLGFTSRTKENLLIPETEPKEIITTVDNAAEDFLLTKKYPDPSESAAEVLKKEEKILQRLKSPQSEEYLQKTSIVVSSQASSQKVELEEALHVMQRDNSMRAVNGFFRLYIFVAILLLIVFKAWHTSSTNTVTNNTTVSTAALLRLMRICHLYSQTGTLLRLDGGVYFIDRYKFLGILNLKLTTVNGIPAIAKNLLDSNNQLRQYVSKIEEKFYQNLYTELPMYLVNASGTVVGNQTTNPFDLVTQLVATADKIVHTPFPLIRGYSSEVQFIHKNSGNQLLVLSEEGLSVISDDTEAKLNDIFNVTIYFIVVMGVLGLAFFCFFLCIANQVVKDQKKTFEFFRRLDEQEIVSYMKTVELFCSMIQQSDMNVQLAAKKIQQKQNCFSEVSATKPSTFHKGKRINKRGVYSTLVQIILVVLALLLVIFSGYIIIIALVKSQNNTINTKVNLLISFNYLAYEYSLLTFVTVEFISGQLTTFRSQPFWQEFDRTYKRNFQMEDTLLEIINPEKGFGEDKMLVDLVNGDLCELIVTDATIALKALGLGDPCDKLAHGVARKGFKASYEFMMYWMQIILSNFEASNQTKLDSIRLLNVTDQKQSDLLGLIYLRYAIEKISNRMEAQLKKDADKFVHSILVVVVVYVVIYATVVLVIWHKIQKIFSAQKIKWRRLFKLVPESIILPNKALTLYLLQNRNRLKR